MAATDPPPELTLTPINGQPRTVDEWLTTFHLLLIVLDPYTNESSWILPVVRRVILTFAQADCRVAILVTADAGDARQFLGPMTKDVLTFLDPEREAVKALGLSRLPALVHLDLGGQVAGSAEGWRPSEWRRACDNLGRVMAWSAPTMPMANDPGAFEGSAAL